MKSEQSAKQILLICTVGGSPEPIIQSITKVNPDRVIFVCTADSEPDISKPRPLLKNPPRRSCQTAPANTSLEAKITDVEAPIESRNALCIRVSDGQRIEKCIGDVWAALNREVEGWLQRGESHVVFVDFTGGTKAMSAGLALCARPWKCQFIYIGGKEREKENLGVVKDGCEELFDTVNPWQILGYQVIEEYSSLFNDGQFAAAQLLAVRARNRCDDGTLKNRFNALATLAEGYAAWEAFDHKRAFNKLTDVLNKQFDSLAACLQEPGVSALKSNLYKNIEQLEKLNNEKASLEFLGDLLANARRRGNERRYDDAVARLYRCTEAIAQYRLKNQYNIESSAVKFKDLRGGLLDKYRSSGPDGTVKLGLQEDYELLREYGDQLGADFSELGMCGEKSPLSSRNGSILAHGFSPISKKSYEALLKKVESLAEKVNISKTAVELPRIGAPSQP